MYSSVWVFLAALALTLGSPVPEDSNDTDLDPSTITFNSDLDVVDIRNDLTSPDVSSNEIIGENSNAVTHPDCLSEGSVDNDFDDKIQKRLTTCPADYEPQNPPKSQPQPQNPAEQSYGTRSRHPKCGENRPHYLSCAGPEIFDPEVFHFLASVFNCVPAVSILIPARPPLFTTESVRDMMDEFCCATFNNESPLYAGVDCRKMTRNVKYNNMNKEESVRWLQQRLPDLPGKIQKFLQSL